MEQLYNPDDHKNLSSWFTEIGAATSNLAPWEQLSRALLSVCAASTVGLLRKARAVDVDHALHNSGLSLGYKTALADYLTDMDEPPFQFATPIPSAADIKERETVEMKPIIYQKKFQSQRDRPTLGSSFGSLSCRSVSRPP
jgi:hypothetical protein